MCARTGPSVVHVSFDILFDKIHCDKSFQLKPTPRLGGKKNYPQVQPVPRLNASCLNKPQAEEPSRRSLSQFNFSVSQHKSTSVVLFYVVKKPTFILFKPEMAEILEKVSDKT